MLDLRIRDAIVWHFTPRYSFGRDFTVIVFQYIDVLIMVRKSSCYAGTCLLCIQMFAYTMYIYYIACKLMCSQNIWQNIVGEHQNLQPIVLVLIIWKIMKHIFHEEATY